MRTKAKVPKRKSLRIELAPENARDAKIIAHLGTLEREGAEWAREVLARAIDLAPIETPKVIEKLRDALIEVSRVPAELLEPTPANKSAMDLIVRGHVKPPVVGSSVARANETARKRPVVGANDKFSESFNKKKGGK